MKKRKITTIKKYGKWGGWDFSKQYSMTNSVRKFTRKDQDNRFRVFETNMPTIKVNPFGRHHALPGQTVWVIRYDETSNRFRVIPDQIDDVHCFAPSYMSYSLRDYWLFRGYHNSGLEPGTMFWFTKKQAEHALTKMNYFADLAEHRRYKLELLKYE